MRNVVRLFVFGSLLLSLSFFTVACGGNTDNNANNSNNNSTNSKAEPAVKFTRAEQATILRLSPLPELPTSPTNKWAYDDKAAHFGQFMFFDKRISANGQVACSTCHEPTKGFGDGLNVSKGLASTNRHAPSVWNTAYNRWFFWDGRADSLWAQAIRPIEDGKEMGFSRLELAHFVANTADIKKAYESIFGALPDISDTKRFPAKGKPGDDDYDNMSDEDKSTITRITVNVGKAIAAYERKIISRDAPFDTFVEGWKEGDAEKLKAMSEQAQRGLKLFVGKARCILCHFGPNFTNGEFHNIGLSLNPDLQRDTGRFDAVSKVKNDEFNGMSPYSDASPDDEFNNKLKFLVQKAHNLGEFKTPSLRSVATSAPYMHDGRFATLKDVINHYNKFPDPPAFSPREEILIKLELTDKEVEDLVAFLQALTGKALPDTLMKQPSSPMP